MAPQEWVVDRSGRLWKVGGGGHDRDHTVVGVQPLTWDVAGAAVEFDLACDDVQLLTAEVGAAPELVDFMAVAYCAFQLGWWSMAADAHAGWPAEATRLQRRRDLYAERLRALLDA